MKYWLNIHDPAPVNEDPAQYHVNLWLQRKHLNTVRHSIKKGDIAVIYETEGPQQREVVDNQGTRTVELRLGRKGIVSVIKLTGDFQEDCHLWDGIPFIGYFKGIQVNVRRNFISLNELREAWIQAGLARFNPRINGGLRELKAEEWQIVSTLMGCTD